MKIHTLSIIAFLASIAAVALVPVSAAAAAVAFTVTGLLTTMVADYGRGAGRPMAPAPVVAFVPAVHAPVEEAA